MHVCTIVAHNYLAQARVLARSLKAADPDATLWVLVVDGVHEGDEEPFELVAPQELDLGDDLAVMRLIYDVTELSTALKPALLRTLLRRTGGPVTYLDPDIEVFASLGEVVRLADTHGLVLTPHLLAPLPDDERQPTDVDILLSGAYNLGFVSMADRPDVHALLDWWDRSLRRDCIIDHSHGRFVDQRFMDLALGFVDDHSCCATRATTWPTGTSRSASCNATATASPSRAIHCGSSTTRATIRAGHCGSPGTRAA